MQYSVACREVRLIDVTFTEVIKDKVLKDLGLWSAYDMDAPWALRLLFKLMKPFKFLPFKRQNRVLKQRWIDYINAQRDIEKKRGYASEELKEKSGLKKHEPGFDQENVQVRLLGIKTDRKDKFGWECV